MSESKPQFEFENFTSCSGAHISPVVVNGGSVEGNMIACPSIGIVNGQVTFNTYNNEATPFSMLIDDEVALLKYLKARFTRRHRDLIQELSTYVLPDIILTPNDTKRISLHDCLFHSLPYGFLQSDRHKLLLIQGDSGSGKSLSLHYVENCIWSVRGQEDNFSRQGFNESEIKLLKKYVPLWIDLREIQEADKEKIYRKGLIYWFLQSIDYQKDQILLLKRKYCFLILLDGLDELPQRMRNKESMVKIFKDIRSYVYEAKVIVTSRTSFLEQHSHYKDLLRLEPDHNVSRSLYECWITPFDQGQIATYISQKISLINKNGQQETFSIRRIDELFQQFAVLKELATSPLLLQMITDSVSIISQCLVKSPRQSVTRLWVFKLFISQWFEREIKRLEIFAPSEKIKTHDFEEFSEKLAFEMFKAGRTEIQYESNSDETSSDSEEELSVSADIGKHFFSAGNSKNMEKCLAAPLRCIEHKYSFYHKSFLEYFVACYLYSSQLKLEESERKFKKKVLDLLECNAFNQKLLTGEGGILDFLAEMLHEETKKSSPKIKYERLFQIVVASRDAGRKIVIAAANAATVLAASKVPFSERDLSQVNIPDADLSGAIISYVNLKEANLQNVKLLSVHLEHTDLTGADLRGAQLGGWPSFEYQHRVHCVNYSHNGCYMAVGEGNDVVLYRRQENGEFAFQAVFVGAPKEDVLGITSLAFHPKKKILASSSHGANLIYLWDLKTSQLLKCFSGHKVVLNASNGVNSLAFSPNGQILASGGYDQGVHLWDTQTYKEIATFLLPNNGNYIYGVAFNGNGKILACNTASYLHIWDVPTGQAIAVLKGSQGIIDSFAFSPREEVVAIGSRGIVNLWCTAPYQKMFSFSLEHKSDHRGQLIEAVAFDSRGEFLAAGTGNNAVYLWNVNTRHLLGLFKGHTYEIKCIAFDPMSLLLASGSWDKTVRFWNINELRVKSRQGGHKGEIESLLFDPADRMVVSSSQDKTIRLWDVETREALASLEARGERHGFITHSNKPLITFTTTGEIIVILNPHQVAVWNPHTFTSQFLPGASEKMGGYGGFLENAAISPKGKILALKVWGAKDNKIILWDIESHQELATLAGNDAESDEIIFNVPEELSFLGKVATQTLLTTLKEQDHEIIHIAFNTTGELLASAHRNGHIRLWDLKTRQLLKTLGAHTSIVCKVAFESSGQLLASSSHDRTVRLWSLKNYQRVATFTDFSYFLDSVVFNSNGQILAVADDSNIHLYHTQTCQKLTCLKGHTSMVKSLTFSLNDLWLASGSADGAIFIWAKCSNTLFSAEKWKLVWRSTNSFSLSAENVFLKETKIAENNLKLLKQRGAKEGSLVFHGSDPAKFGWERAFPEPFVSTKPILPSIFKQIPLENAQDLSILKVLNTAKISLTERPNKEFVQVKFFDMNLAKDFVTHLFKMGIDNLNMRGRPRDIEMPNEIGKMEFSVFLAGGEYDQMVGAGAYERLKRGGLYNHSSIRTMNNS